MGEKTADSAVVFSDSGSAVPEAVFASKREPLPAAQSGIGRNQ